jgi:hypothetical protein
MADARSKKAIENKPQDNYQVLCSQALSKISVWSMKKKDAAIKNRNALGIKFPIIKRKD